jgi:hypothetical protein
MSGIACAAALWLPTLPTRQWHTHAPGTADTAVAPGRLSGANRHRPRRIPLVGCGYNLLMQTAVLGYAGVSAPSRWRRARTWSLRIVVAAVVCLLAKTVYTRVRMLEGDPWIGPVDWRHVVTSPRLLRTAWALAGDPRKVKDPAVFGVRPGKLSVTVAHPLRFEQGRLGIDLIVRNDGSRTVVLPPFIAVGTISDTGSCMTSAVGAIGHPALGKGVRLVAPGTSVTVPLRVAACSHPTSAGLTVELFDRVWTFFIFPTRRASSWLGPDRVRIQEWADVPAGNIRCVYEDHVTGR